MDESCVNAQYIQDTLVKPALCFTNKKKIAIDYLDFTQVVRTQKPSTNDIEENEVAFNMRMDERILPVGPNSDNSFVTVTIEAEVYYKGNRHPTRRLLQTDAAAAGTRNQKHALSVGYGVQHKPAIETCVVDNKQEEGMMKLSMSYADEKSMPKAGDMSTFVSQLTMQLDAYHEVRGAMSVEKVERCDKRCTMMYARGAEKNSRRRAEVAGAHLNVFLKFNSVDTNKAGYIMNIFQNNLNNPRSEMHKQVALFALSTTSKLAVDGCNGVNLGMVKKVASPVQDKVDDLVDMLKEESSAVRPTALLAFALLYLAW